MIIPTALTPEEKKLKQVFEKIKNDRRNLEAALKKASSLANKSDQRQSKESVDDADSNREEVLKKLAAGKITLEKTDEKQTFKRNRVARKESTTFETPKFDLSQDGFKFETSRKSMPTSSNSMMREVNRGPTLYVRGYNLREGTLNSSFSKFGQIQRCYVEERQRSAFVTLGSVQEAEAAIQGMNGTLLDGISIQVSFARRQNQQNLMQPKWHQPLVSGVCTGSSNLDNSEISVMSGPAVERQTVKRPLVDSHVPKVNPERAKYEEGELFDNAEIA